MLNRFWQCKSRNVSRKSLLLWHTVVWVDLWYVCRREMFISSLYLPVQFSVNWRKIWFLKSLPSSKSFQIFAFGSEERSFHIGLKTLVELNYLWLFKILRNANSSVVNKGAQKMCHHPCVTVHPGPSTRRCKNMCLLPDIRGLPVHIPLKIKQVRERN